MQYLTKLSAQQIAEMVMRVVGPVQPTGEHNTDKGRLENMEVLIEVVDRLLHEISCAEPSANRPEASMKVIGKCASNFLKEIKEDYYL